MNLLLFEDDLVDQLSPITLTRPAWAVSCGSYRLIDLIDQDSFSKIGLRVRPHLASLMAADWPDFVNEDELRGSTEPTLWLNARLVPSEKTSKVIQLLCQQASEPKLIMSGETLVAAMVPQPDQLPSMLESAERFPADFTQATDMSLFEYPHDVIRHHMEQFGASLQHRIATGDYRQLTDGVFVARENPTALPDSCHFDTTRGAVVFESNINVGPCCFFRGPVHIANNCKISEHSSLKDAVAISHTCKMGGEIEGVQTEPWSNKQHFGFLGHSWIGSWINLGAGTCNSDLKNTYGTVNMTYGDNKVSTGMQFVGCVMGDYSRTAINTSIYTGKNIGVGSTLYGITTRNVPSFVNWAQVLGQYGVVPPKVIATIQGRMFGRRNVEQRPCDIQLINDVFEMTSTERNPDWSTDPVPQ